MTLTRKQRKVAFDLTLAGVVVLVIGVLCYVIVTTIAKSPAAQASVRTVNAQSYEQISLGNDGTVDHFCLGTTGIWYGPNNGDFAVEAGDPQCR